MKHTSKRRKRTSTRGDRVAYTLLSYHERVLLEVRELLWPNGDADHEWSADTLDDIARTLDRAGFGRRKR